MSLSVEGIKPKDEKFNKMLEIYRQCDEMGFAPPVQIYNFFGGIALKYIEERFSEGIPVDLDANIVLERYAECQDVLIVDLSKLPKDVTQLRVAYSH